MEKVPELFPFWQAHEHHGYPLLADPENHMPFSLILNTESPNFNINLNLIFFCLTAFFASSCRAIARIMGMSQVASFTVGLTSIVSCISISRSFMHGALSAFILLDVSFVALSLLAFIVANRSSKFFFILPLISLILAWDVLSGYYLPLVFYAPALAILVCLYVKNNETFADSIKYSLLILSLVSLLMALFSMPILLPVIDGIVSSRYFAAESPKITISSAVIYNYYFGLWPFIILSFIYSRGYRRKWVYAFMLMAAINYILVLFAELKFDGFFSLWDNIPVLKNIRFQFPFSQLAGISASFCAGIFIDSIRDKTKKDNFPTHLTVLGFVLLMCCIAVTQRYHNIPNFMMLITFICIVISIVRKNVYVVFALFLSIIALLGYNLNESPLTNKAYFSKNNQTFSNYSGPYYWLNFSGRDKFTPYFVQSSFSMVFLHEYRLLLSLLYGKEVKAQRPQWIESYDGINLNKYNEQIADLMGIRPGKAKDDSAPFRVYDKWLVADENSSVAMMRNDDFSVSGPILLSSSPQFVSESEHDLEARVKLTGKTADTLTLDVSTNKNSIVLVPEIYHQNWYAWVDGEKSPVIKAYGSMRAVSVPPGKHEIVMRFVYMPFWWGSGIAIISLILSFIVAYRYRFLVCTQSLGMRRDEAG
ncbi:MAG: YfhO family protein [Proteobacteria bacterium]|nr:YfhO family protein [Desulfobulbaceae bacterium]MBU4152335.1 YfhO family protein [Pseudomonadota bacterium]